MENNPFHNNVLISTVWVIFQLRVKSQFSKAMRKCFRRNEDISATHSNLPQSALYSTHSTSLLCLWQGFTSVIICSLQGTSPHCYAIFFFIWPHQGAPDHLSWRDGYVYGRLGYTTLQGSRLTLSHHPRNDNNSAQDEIKAPLGRFWV